MMHGGGGGPHLGKSSINAPDVKPRVTWGLLKRVLGYARPYLWLIVGMLLITLLTSGLSLLNPLILRDMIDRTLPNKDLGRLAWLVAAMLTLPLMTRGSSLRLALFPVRAPAAHVFEFLHTYPGG
jgi:ATP-binding cassette subfamily B protein